MTLVLSTLVVFVLVPFGLACLIHLIRTLLS